jgi:DinB family protein
MKTLRNPAEKQELLRRIASVQASTPRLWGKMSAHQMICHLADGYRLYLGDLHGEPHPAPAFVKAIVKTVVVYVPLQWPKGRIPTLPSLDQAAGRGTAPVEFARDTAALCDLLERFTRVPQDFRFNPHPGLGAMSYSQWMRLGYLHSDHHLRQFGA